MKVSCQLHVLANLHPRKPDVTVENCMWAPEWSCMWKLKEIILAPIEKQNVSHIISYRNIPYHYHIISHIISHILSNHILYYIILYYIILYYIILYYIILYYIILYYIILYYIILYYIILYYINTNILLLLLLL